MDVDKLRRKHAATLLLVRRKQPHSRASGREDFPRRTHHSVITTWRAGARSSVRVGDLTARVVAPQFETTPEDLLALPKWPGYGNPLPSPMNGGATLGDYFRVSRGQVIGLNEIWTATRETQKLIPGHYLFPCVTDAMDVIKANGPSARTLISSSTRQQRREPRILISPNIAWDGDRRASRAIPVARD